MAKFYFKIETEQRDHFEKSLCDFSDVISSKNVEIEKGVDGYDLLHVMLDFVGREGALIYSGYLIGKGVTFSFDDGGLNIHVKSPTQLVNSLKELFGNGDEGE